MRNFIFVLCTLLFLVAATFVYWVFIQIPIPSIPPTHVMKKLYSSSLNNYIYLRRETRGLNYEKTTITASSDSVYVANPEVDYIFESSSVPIFYYVKQDTLVAYSSAHAVIPPRTVHNFKVKLIELSSSESKALQKHYREQGLGIF